MLSLYGKEHYKEIFTNGEKKLLWRKLPIKKDRLCMVIKEARKLVARTEQGHYPVWWGVSYDGITSNPLRLQIVVSFRGQSLNKKSP
jgi:hypothetical protein